VPEADPADRYQKVAELIGALEPLTPVSYSSLPKKVGALDRARLSIRTPFARRPASPPRPS